MCVHAPACIHARTHMDTHTLLSLDTPYPLPCCLLETLPATSFKHGFFFPSLFSGSAVLEIAAVDVVLWEVGRENGEPSGEGEIRASWARASSHLKVGSTCGLLQRQQSGSGTGRAALGGPGSRRVYVRVGFIWYCFLGCRTRLTETCPLRMKIYGSCVYSFPRDYMCISQSEKSLDIVI